jgi:peptidoglycan/LPS O-acetylase OafA/YrhL
MEFYPRLNSLRALAVIMVICAHWLPPEFFIHRFNPGSAGVQIFFVLSGFLITRNLLSSRSTAAPGKIYGNFIIRRSLRIFPIYYLTLVLVLLIGKHNTILNSGTIPYYFLYATNFLTFQQQFWHVPFAHLWSLAVEEQFYLIWPWFMLLIPARRLPVVFLSFMAIALIFRVSLLNIFPENEFIYILTPACFDGFAIGGFLAYVVASGRERVWRLAKKFYLVGAIASFLYIASYWSGNTFSLWHNTLVHVFAVSLIILAIHPSNSLSRWNLLDQRGFQWIGQVSYGLYLFHPFVAEFCNGSFRWLAGKGIRIWDLPSPFAGLATLSIYSFILLAVAGLSWLYIEKPINDLKRFFPYGNARTAPELITAKEVY